jgi:hypothetical protein
LATSASLSPLCSPTAADARWIWADIQVAPPILLLCWRAAAAAQTPSLELRQHHAPLGGAGCMVRKVPLDLLFFCGRRQFWRGEEEAHGRGGSSPRRRRETTRCTMGSRASARPLGTGRPRRVLRRRGSRRWERAGCFRKMVGSRLIDASLIGSRLAAAEGERGRGQRARPTPPGARDLPSPRRRGRARWWRSPGGGVPAREATVKPRARGVRDGMQTVAGKLLFFRV